VLWASSLYERTLDGQPKNAWEIAENGKTIKITYLNYLNYYPLSKPNHKTTLPTKKKCLPNFVKDV
jgi:hypothetical protein